MLIITEKVLITGVTGFVGKQLLHDLRQNYDQLEIYAVVRENSKSNDELEDDIKQIVSDFSEPERLFQDLKNNITELNGVTIYHCAAVLSANQAWKPKYDRVNVNSTIKLGEFAMLVEAKRFVFLSSMGAAGPVGSVNEPMNEKGKEKPISFYSKSKLTAERELESILQDDIPLIIFRPPNIYGPEMNMSSGSALMFKGMKRRFFPILGSGKNFLNMIYVGNLTHAMIYVSERVESGVEVFFIKDPSDITTLEFLELIKSEFKTSTKLIKLPKFLIWLPAKLMDMLSLLIRKNIGFNSEILIGGTSNGYYFTIEKINTFGYSPPFKLKKSIEMTCEFVNSSISK